MVDHSITLSGEGLILGASATAGGSNVSHRLAVLDRLHPIQGEVFADLGCGVGAYSAALLAKHPRKMILADIEAHNIEAAQTALAGASLEKQFITSPLETLELPENSIDCIFMIEVLDHVRDVARCFAQAQRFLKPGGRLYIAVPNQRFPLETHPVKWRKRFYMPYYFPFLPWFPTLHEKMATARVFSNTQLRQLAADAGLGAPAIDYIMPPMEHRGPALLRQLMSGLEATPLICFCVSTCAVMVKPA